MTEDKVISIINQTLNLNLDPDTPTDVPLKSIGIDSLDFFNVLVGLENETGQSVPDDDVDKLTTISDVARYFS